MIIEYNCDIRIDPTTLLPTLWIGTTLGSVLTMMISLPEADLRHTQPVVVSTSGEFYAIVASPLSYSCLVRYAAATVLTGTRFLFFS